MYQMSYQDVNIECIMNEMCDQCVLISRKPYAVNNCVIVHHVHGERLRTHYIPAVSPLPHWEHFMLSHQIRYPMRRPY